MPNIVNRMVVREYTDMFADEANLLVVSFHGLDMVSNEMLRGRLAEKGAPLRMVRNKLARRVLAERGAHRALQIGTPRDTLVEEHRHVPARVVPGCLREAWGWRVRRRGWASSAQQQRVLGL